MDVIDRISGVLRHAEASRSAVGPVSELVEGGLSIELSHAICEANIARREAAGARVAGYKVGFTNIAAREKMGLPDSTYGYLLDSMVLESGGRLVLREFIAPRIESEICIRLGRQLAGPGVTAPEVLEAADSVRASFEICDARILDWKCPYPDFFADNGFSARVVLGEHGWVPISEVDLLAETVHLDRDGEPVGEGRGEMALGSPANAVAWLANKLAARGRGLGSGQLVMTGTLTPITPIESGSTYTASFSSLGRVAMTFER